MLPAVFDFLNGPVRDLVTQVYEAVGYLGVFVAAALALAQLGLILDRIAIVAGALSVGIGMPGHFLVRDAMSRDVAQDFCPDGAGR